MAAAEKKSSSRGTEKNRLTETDQVHGKNRLAEKKVNRPSSRKKNTWSGKM
jgi:hypothetical protein